ncbi:hypothetical protein RDV89_10555 [Nocardioides zeae]|uniref:Asp23/Gls24 family envelope stress response protein n=1 Tax=Nocardioides imazamoxiresistens TaxID=3231893 RepID=A0ABU3PW98_9ACTN|nr:hypothetical protein [Nocardioides zeae]MDT9593508.1 hypothetical protein [Nocardioides zeae]
MAVEPYDPFDRATDVARREARTTPDGWIEIVEAVRAGVRASVAPSPPLVTFGPDGTPSRDDSGSRTLVSERVVRTVLRRALDKAETHAPEDIRLVVEDGRLAAVEVDLVAAYGAPLAQVGEAVRVLLLEVLRDLLGPDPDFDAPHLGVTFTDVVVGDPRVS